MELQRNLHSFCYFYKDEKLSPAWIENIQKNKWMIRPLKGKSFLISPNHTLYHWKPSRSVHSWETAEQQIHQEIEQAQEQIHSIDIQTIYELCELDQVYTIPQLADLFLDQPENLIEQLALFLTLEDNRVLFKKKADGYSPRSTQEVQQIQIREEKENEKKRYLAQISQWLAQIDSGEWNASTPCNEEQSVWIAQLESLLLYGKDSPFWDGFANTLHLNPNTPDSNENRIRTWLKNIGQPISWSRFLLLRAKVKETFSPQVLQEAENLSKSNPEHRTPPNTFAQSAVFTIDAESTEDYDDGLSVQEWNERSIRLTVHIANVAMYLEKESPLFQEAQKRISTVYTPKRNYPMLPFELSTNFFSLRQQSVRDTMNFHFRLFVDGNYLLEEIEMSPVWIEENLTYEQVDEKIENQESYWFLLLRCCQALQEKRIENGALEFHREEVEIDICQPEQIQITKVQRNDSFANLIIKELAILVNEEAGKYCTENQCLSIFRTQEMYEIIHQAENEEIKLEHVQMQPVRLSTQASRHHGIACDHYMQVTSPIRRFGDLVAQSQLLHVLKEQTENCYSEEELLYWIECMEVANREYAKASFGILDHWKAKYLLQNMDRIFEVIIKKQLPQQNTILEIRDILLSFVSKGFSQYEIGESLFVCIQSVKLEPHSIQVRPVEA